jgi:hypothetical protein
MFPLMSYNEYLQNTGKDDCKNSWIDWKAEIHGMFYSEAIKAAHDPEWGYRPLCEDNPYKFNYQLLARLQSDCNYYLGYGNRCAKHLWAGNEQDQIDKMKELWNNFPDDQKPEWLTWEQILDYEKEMVA